MEGMNGERNFGDPELEQRLRADLAWLAVPRHARWDALSLLSLRSRLLERLQSLGRVQQHRFGEGAAAGVNLILRLPGQQPQLAPWLVGAHYDGPLGSPGADHNATGVAALLELGRRLTASPARRPLWLVAFDQKEAGMLGSMALARELRHSRQPLHGMLSLDMLGYTAETQTYPLDAMRAVYGGRGDFIALVGNLAASSLLLTLGERMGGYVSTKVLPMLSDGRLLPEVRRSDHSPFWDACYNAVLVTDTAFLRNPHVNKPTDTLETLDLSFLMAVIGGLEAALSSL